MITAEVLEKL